MRVPFYWREWNDAHNKSVRPSFSSEYPLTLSQGRYEHPHIVKILGLAHLPVLAAASQEILELFDEFFQDVKPSGALVMAGLAVSALDL